MIKIISDTCTLYSPSQAQELNLEVTPLHINVNNQTYREYVDIDDRTLFEMIKEGALPVSSQPSIGEKIDLYNKYGKDHEVIDITMADGLSGTYQSALSAKENCEYPDKITIFNSRTLCGPQRYLAQEAVKMADEGKSKAEILNMLEKSAASDHSFLMPVDFGFLQRGGRIGKTAAGLGGLLKLIICMKKSDDGKVLEKFSLTRTLNKTLKNLCDTLLKAQVDDTYRFTIAHADNEDLAKKSYDYLRTVFQKAIIDIVPLSPVFITHGGPGCCSIQTIKIQR